MPRSGWGWMAPATIAVLLSSCSAATPRTTAPAATASSVAAPTLGIAARPESIVDTGALDRPRQPAMPATYRADLVADYCVDRDMPAPPATDPAMVVLDRSYALSADYVPADLVPASAAGLASASGTELVGETLIDDLAAMAAAWDAAGLTIAIESGYRSFAGQAATFDSWVARLGHAEALGRAARPGHSEHQLGTALDLTSPGWSGRFGDWAVESAEGSWMAAHGWEYGFVMSYPAGGQDETCFSYEPWHYRWIGRQAAARQHESGLELRRFLERFVGE